MEFINYNRRNDTMCYQNFKHSSLLSETQAIRAHYIFMYMLLHAHVYILPF